MWKLWKIGRLGSDPLQARWKNASHNRITMKSRWLLVALAFVLCSCKEKVPRAQNDATLATPAAVAEAPLPQTPVAKPPPRQAKATQKQLGSLLRVRVAFGGLPAQDSAAALLHRDEIPDPALTQGKGRFVLALLRGWKEAQLRSKDVRIVVYRNKVDTYGQTVTGAHSARLVKFDAATGLAVLMYADKFEYSADIGFHLEQNASAHSELALIRTFSDGIVPAPPPATPEPATPDPSTLDPRKRAELQALRQMTEMRARMQPAPLPAQPFSSDFGIYRAATENRGAVEFSALKSDATGDSVHLGVSEPDKLIAFVEEKPDGSVNVTPVGKLSLAIKTPTLKAKDITFKGTGRSVEVGMEIETTPPELAPAQVDLWVRELGAEEGGFTAPKNSAGAFAPIENARLRSLFRNGKSAPWQTSLEAPTEFGERVYVVQLTWPLIGEFRAVMGFSAPFIVRLQRRPDGIHPKLESLDNANAPMTKADAPEPDAPAVAGPATPFPLESPVRNVVPIAGGREALLELSGAPYWKRFSFAKNEWMPLPNVNLSMGHLAGNLGSLFLLERNTGQVTKYSLANLQLLGTTQLGSKDCIAILAGCNTDHAPIHVLTANDATALSPATLQRCDVPAAENRSYQFTRDDRFVVTGDGLGFARITTSRTSFYCYNGDTRGLMRNYFDTHSGNTDDEPRGVTPGFVGYEYILESKATPGGVTFKYEERNPWSNSAIGMASNCPVIIRIRSADKNAAPPRPPRLAMFSYFDKTPFAECDVPELAELTEPNLRKRKWQACFDPYSLQLAVVSADGKTWSVRKFTAPETRKQPVLLNWPDTSFVRGTDFQFRPVLWGGKAFTAEIFGKPMHTTVNEAEGTVRVSIPADEFASLQLLTLKVPGQDGAELSYPISLHATGPELPFASLFTANHENLNSQGNGFKTLGNPVSDFVTLPTSLHLFADSIINMQGPVSGCVALVTNANRVDFFSLQNRKVIGSITGPPGANYFAGAGALFEFDTAKGTLTRISVPDGKREQSLNFPEKLSLAAIGVGTAPDSPITLVVKVTQGRETLRLGDFIISGTRYGTIVTVRDANTLQTAGWAQPLSFNDLMNKPDESNWQSIFLSGDSPRVLPTSHSGRVVWLQSHFLALSARLSVAFPIPQKDSNRTEFGHIFDGRGRQPTGSISGLTAIASDGVAFKGGINVPWERPDNETREALGGTPCGRYAMWHVSSRRGGNDGCVLEIYLSENSRPLMRVARLGFFADSQFVYWGKNGRHSAMLGDEGPLALLDKTGRALQLVDLNIPQVMKSLAPEDFHVVSQPVPCAVEGSRMQYQVRVNNPDVVASYRLQTNVDGAVLSPEGLFQFTAPTTAAEPKTVTISIEITGKNKKVLLHEFPIHILPGQNRPKPPAKDSVSKPTIKT